MLRKIPQLNVFRVNRRSFSVYLIYFQYILLIKRNLSDYLSDWVFTENSHLKQKSMIATHMLYNTLLYRYYDFAPSKENLLK